MTKRNVLGIFAAASLLATPTVAFAGTLIYGSGVTRGEAMRDAENRGQQIAKRNNTCITTYATPENCKEDSGGWSCWVVVADHRGSCG